MLATNCRGHRVTQACIMDAIRVDPEGVAIRWSSTVQRHKYTVSSPLALWHIDGNHKLIRYSCFTIYIRLLFLGGDYFYMVL